LPPPLTRLLCFDILAACVTRMETRVSARPSGRQPGPRACFNYNMTPVEGMQMIARLGRLIIVFSLALVGAAPLAPSKAAELVPFPVGQAAPANTFLAIWMAQAAGFYEAQGLQVTIVPLVGGSQSGPELKSGRIHLMHIGMSSVVRANTTGLGDLRCVGSLANVIRSTMFTAPGIKTAADLKGRIIGISSVGSESDSTTTLALKRLGLSRNDVIVKETGVDRFAAVRKGEI